MTNLVIGTANFGNHYGITEGCIDENQAKEIFASARKNNITTIDTAYSYSRSYEVLSKSKINDFKLITKTPKFSNCQNKKEILELFYKFIKKTKEIFGLQNIQAILLHNPNDLLLANGELIYSELKKISAIHNIKIGISVYDIPELTIADKYDISIIQVPLNIFDQRFIADDITNFLQSKKIELHSRSLFLQGLLLMDIEKVKKTRPEAVDYIDALDQICLNKKISRLELCILFIKKIKQISSCVVGINSLKNLEEIIAIWNSAIRDKSLDVDFENLKISNDLIIDPRKWKH